MKQLRALLFLAAAVLLILTGCATTDVQGQQQNRQQMQETQEERTLVILHTNDEHGVIENMGKIGWYRQQMMEKHDDVILVSAGDSFSGNPVVDEYVIDGENLRGKPMTETMNAAGYEVQTLGNHSFDYGQKRLQESMEAADFVKILANMEVGPEAEMEQPAPYHTIETDFGATVNFLGLIQVDGEYPSTLPLNLTGLNFLDPVETALEYRHLTDESDLFVSLSHLGHDWDRELAKAMGELDVIIGGHSHTAVADPVFVDDILITQSGSDTENLGKITITFDENNEIVDRQYELVSMEDIEGTEESVEERIAEFESKVEEIFARQINHLEEPITGKEDLGALMTDALVESPKIADMGYEVDMAFQNSGGIRVDQLYAGPLTVGEIFELEPFGNNVIMYQMTTDDIRSLLANDFEERGYVDLRAGGVQYEIEAAAEDEVETIHLYDSEGNELDEDATYTVALNSYIASSYDFEARNDGENTYLRHNDLLIHYVEEVISREDLNEGYRDLSRTGMTLVGEGEFLADTEASISASGKMSGSTSAGNLMADAIRAVIGADIATFPSYSGLNEGAEAIPSGGEITDLNVSTLYGQYIDENRAVVGEISGEDLEAFILERCSEYDNVDLQVSGMNYALRTEEGSVTGIETNLEPDTMYTVTFNSYEYGNNYQPIEGFEQDYTTDATEKEMLMEYLRGRNVIGEEVAEERVEME